MLFFSSIFFGSKFFLWMCFFSCKDCCFDAMLSKLFPVETLSFGTFLYKFNVNLMCAENSKG